MIWRIPPELRQKWLCEKIWKKAKYTPFKEHQAFHDNPSRLKLVAGGVGAGKSWSTSMELAKYIGIPNGVIWIVGPSYELATPEFMYLYNVLDDLGAIDKNHTSLPQNGARRFKLLPEWGGCEVLTKTSDSNERLAGVRPNALAVTEAAQHPSSIFEKVIERGTEKRANVVFSGTFEGAYGWYAQKWERWQGSNPEGGVSFSIPTWANLFHYPGGRQDAEILRVESIMSPELFMERYGGVPCKPSGLVFKEFSPKTHCKPFQELFDESLPVEIWVDPGVHCYAVLFAQVQADGKTVHILDEVYLKNVIGQQVVPEVVRKPLWEFVQGGVIDIFGTRRQGANKSQVEVWADTLAGMGVSKRINWRTRLIQDVTIWYNQLHLRLWHDERRQPLMYFADHLNARIADDGSVFGILGELMTHRWADHNELQAYPTRPIKKNEDALSAAGYGCVIHFGPVEQRRPIDILPQRNVYF